MQSSVYKDLPCIPVRCSPDPHFDGITNISVWCVARSGIEEADVDAVNVELTSREEAINHLQDVLVIGRALPST